MARLKRLESSFQSDNGTFYRIEVYDNNASAPTLYTPDLGPDGFTLTYQTNDNDRFTGLIPSEVKFDINVTIGGEQGVVDDIRTSAYGDWDIGIYISDDDVTYNRYWFGILLNDISPEADASFPTRITLTAVCGLAPLKDIPFNRNIGYDTPSSYQTINYFRLSFVNQISTADNYFGANDLFIATYVDWTTDTMTRQVQRDPLNASRFNFMAFVDIADDGSRNYKTAFELLDSICKSWGMRCFMSNGRWNLVQVNHYADWKTPSTQYYRYYKKGSSNPYASGSTSAVFTEGFNIKRYGGKFDYLPILRSVETNYNHLQPFDMPFFYYNIDGDTSTQYQTTLNEIPIWNGYQWNNSNYTGAAYSINNAPTDKLIISLGNVNALTGSSILLNRDFSTRFTSGLTFSDVSGSQQKVRTDLFARFKLVGDSDTYYFPLSTALAMDWTTNDQFTLTDSIPPQYLNIDEGPLGTNININIQTTELPVNGDLFFEIYAECYYQLYANALAILGEIEITEATTTTQEDNILVFSAPETSSEQGIKYLLDNEVLSAKFFKAFNAPGGTTIDNGVKFEIPELFIGTGPTSGAVGRLETYNYTTNSFENGMNATWKAYGSGTGVEFTQLLVEEVLKGQAEGAKVFNGSLKTVSGFIPRYLNGIEIDGSPYIPYQCSFNANEDTWSGEWYGIELSTNTQNVEVNITSFDVFDGQEATGGGDIFF
jgi:hypothetical protein